MGSGNEKLKILKNHEADIERIRSMERIADQEAEIKRIAEQNHYKLGMENIKAIKNYSYLPNYNMIINNFELINDL